MAKKNVDEEGVNTPSPEGRAESLKNIYKRRTTSSAASAGGLETKDYSK